MKNYMRDDQYLAVVSFILALVVLSILLCGCQGPTGSSIIGPKGDQGSPGTPGAQGPAGTDGQIATVIALCPNTPVYGSVYTEVALCINNQLYAVYSANGGFLTLLTPGAYHSDAIGSACSFTVAPNCTLE